MKHVLCAAIAVCVFTAAAFSQTPPAPQSSASPAAAPAGTDYVIGPGDVLDIVVRNDSSLNATALVRPDGKITITLLSDIQAAGLTTMQLNERIVAGLSRFYTSGVPTVTVSLVEMKSKVVYIQGRGIAKSVSVPLTGPLTIMQLIAIGGGLTEYAKSKEIRVFRQESGVTKAIPFNYKTFQDTSDLKQNIELRSGDVVDVP